MGRTRRGTNVVEFALTLPLFILLFGGVIDLGWLFVQYSAMNASVHTGCRAGSTLDPGPGRVDLALDLTQTEGFIVQSLQESAAGCNSCTATARAVYLYPEISLECTLQSDYQPLWGVMGPITLRTNTITRMEYQRE